MRCFEIQFRLQVHTRKLDDFSEISGLEKSPQKRQIVFSGGFSHGKSSVEKAKLVKLLNYQWTHTCIRIRSCGQDVACSFTNCWDAALISFSKKELMGHT